MAYGAGSRPPYFVVVRLIRAATDLWTTFDGKSAAEGFDPLDLPLDRFLNLTYYYLVRGKSEQDVAKFEAELWRPPTGQGTPATGAWSEEAEMAAFKASQRTTPT